MSGRLHIVSGKGGVGKTLIATALARQFAERGEKTLLVDLSDAGAPAGALGVAPAYVPQPVTESLHIARLDARESVKEYVKRKMSFSFAYRGLLENSAVQKFLDALPLFDELMALGKLYDHVTSAQSTYQRVVFDAPATGHAKLLLNVPAVAVDTLKAGPIYDSAGKILQLLRDPERCELIVAALPEETPVREALELVEDARERLGIRCERVILNRCIDSCFAADERKVIAAMPSSSKRWAALLNESIADQQAEQARRLAAASINITRVNECTSRQPGVVLEQLVRQL